MISHCAGKKINILHQSRGKFGCYVKGGLQSVHYIKFKSKYKLNLPLPLIAIMNEEFTTDLNIEKITDVNVTLLK